MNEKQAVSILLANLKGAKKKPSNLIQVAEACNFLLHHTKWGIEKMSNFFEISQFMLRQISKISNLHDTAKKFILQNKLGIEQAYQLSRIKNEKTQNEVAEEIINLNSHETRVFINKILTTEKKETVKKLSQKYNKQERDTPHLVVLPLPNKTFKKLKSRSKSEQMSIQEFIQKSLEGILNAG